MKLRSLLFNAAAEVGPGNGGGAPQAPTPPAGGQGVGEKGDPKGDPKVDPAKELKETWKGKDYADLAAHHTKLIQQGALDEAAFFHKHLVLTYKPSRK